MTRSSLTQAIVRRVSRSLAACQLRHLPRQAIDLRRAEAQHASYVRALEAAGATVTVLPELPDLPDATFVEDPAVVLDEVAVRCRPGHATREAEAAAIAPEIARLRPVVAIEAPATLEGGDVLRRGRTLFVGESSRTNPAGIEQLRARVGPLGYRVVPVRVTGCLHLKTAATFPAPGLLLANPDWMDLEPFAEVEILRVPPAEPWGANTLPVNGCVLVAASAPQTAALLAARGLDVRPVDISELQKAEAGLTCLSILCPRG
jgi:dimethylargininase